MKELKSKKCKKEIDNIIWRLNKILVQLSNKKESINWVTEKYYNIKVSKNSNKEGIRNSSSISFDNNLSNKDNVT